MGRRQGRRKATAAWVVRWMFMFLLEVCSKLSDRELHPCRFEPPCGMPIHVPCKGRRTPLERRLRLKKCSGPEPFRSS